jgi:CheY-like chemotaxis protein
MREGVMPIARTILVAEDEEELNDLLAYNLRREGYRVRQTLDGRKALDQVADERPDLILVDVLMPEADGWTVCEELLADESSREIPVVFFTAKGTREDFDRANAYPNVCGFFVKPYALGDVIRHVARVLANRGL